MNKPMRRALGAALAVAMVLPLAAVPTTARYIFPGGRGEAHAFPRNGVWLRASRD